MGANSRVDDRHRRGYGTVGQRLRLFRLSLESARNATKTHATYLTTGGISRQLIFAATARTITVLEVGHLCIRTRALIRRVRQEGLAQPEAWFDISWAYGILVGQ